MPTLFFQLQHLHPALHRPKFMHHKHQCSSGNAKVVRQQPATHSGLRAFTGGLSYKKLGCARVQKVLWLLHRLGQPAAASLLVESAWPLGIAWLPLFRDASCYEGRRLRPESSESCSNLRSYAPPPPLPRPSPVMMLVSSELRGRQGVRARVCRAQRRKCMRRHGRRRQLFPQQT